MTNPLATLASTGTLTGHDLSDFDFEALSTDQPYNFTDCTLTGARIKGDALAGSRWTGCTILDSAFVSTDLTGAVFERCRFFDSERRTGSEFRFADLREASFTHSDLSLVKFTGCEAHDLTASDCRMRGLAIANTGFARDIARVRHNRARFTDCDLADARLSGIDLSDCTLERCILRGADLTEANLTDATLTDCDLSDAEWDSADLTNADLRRSTLAGLTLPVLRAYPRLRISAAQQHWLLASLAIDVWPDEE